MVDLLINRAGKTHISVTRGDTNVDFSLHESRKRSRGGKNSPTKPELKQEAIAWLEEHHPEDLKCDLEKLFHSLGWIIIFTPPYMPIFQPIEMIWAYGKNFVARTYTNTRTKDQARQAIFDGFYGSKDHNHSGVSAEMCEKIINNCLEACNMHIKEDELLGGNIHDLVSIREESENEKIELEFEELQDEVQVVDSSDKFFGSGKVGDDVVGSDSEVESDDEFKSNSK